MLENAFEPKTHNSVEALVPIVTLVNAVQPVKELALIEVIEGNSILVSATQPLNELPP